MKVKISMGVIVTLTFIAVATHFDEVTGAPLEDNLHNQTIVLETNKTTEDLVTDTTTEEDLDGDTSTEEDPETDTTTEEEEDVEIDTGTPPPPLTPEEKKCSEMIGHFQDDVWVGLEVKYDLKSVLAKYGGPPGEVNVTWTEKKAAPVENATDERPLPIADPEYWLYSYTGTDGDTWARGEHAVHRFSGTPKEFLEIRGMILWAPEDFCGRLRSATYTVDDRGFTFEVTREYCWIHQGGHRYSCAWPATCGTSEDGTGYCVAAPYIDLLSALVGGG